MLGSCAALVCCRVNYDELPETQLTIQGAGESSTGADAGESSATGGSSSSGGSSNGGSRSGGGSSSQLGGAANDASAGEPGSAGVADPGGGSGGTSSAGSSNGGSSSGGTAGTTSGGSAGTGGGAGGCTTATYGGHDYLACTSPKSFIDAAVDCAARGYRPVRIDSAAEQTFVHDQIPIADQNNNNVSVWRWLGGTATGAAGDWQWSDGTKFWTGGKGGTAVNGAYANWSNGQPGGGLAACLSMQARAGTWNGLDCSAAKPYICEKY